MISKKGEPPSVLISRMSLSRRDGNSGGSNRLDKTDRREEFPFNISDVSICDQQSDIKNLGHLRASRTGIVVSILPGLLALGLFYSLAVHMHRALGGWPSGIGEAGFPPALATHANIAASYFGILLLLSFFTLPVAILVCLFVSRWRHLVPYFALYAFVFIISIGLMQFAPAPFLNWWRD